MQCDWGSCEAMPEHKIRIGHAETYYLCGEHVERARNGELIPGEETDERDGTPQ